MYRIVVFAICTLIGFGPAGNTTASPIQGEKLVAECESCSVEGALPRDFAFERCTDTGHHVAVAQQDDHIMVHYHVRVTNQAGKTIYVRQRSVSPGQDDESLTVYKKQIETNDELFSVYLRCPRYTDAKQDALVYQTEVGVFDVREFNEFQFPDLTFAWRLKRGNGRRMTPVAEETTLAVGLREYVVEGTSIRIRSSYAARANETDLLLASATSMCEELMRTDGSVESTIERGASYAR